VTAPREFTWNGVARYGCPICRWDTGDRESMAEHLAVVHQVAISAPAEVIRRKPAKATPEPEVTVSAIADDQEV